MTDRPNVTIGPDPLRDPARVFLSIAVADLDELHDAATGIVNFLSEVGEALQPLRSVGALADCGDRSDMDTRAAMAIVDVLARAIRNAQDVEGERLMRVANAILCPLMEYQRQEGAA